MLIFIVTPKEVTLDLAVTLCHWNSRLLLLFFLIAVFSIFPGGSDGEESACYLRDPSLISGLGRSPGQENGNPPQYSCLENPLEREASWAIVHGVAECQ